MAIRLSDILSFSGTPLLGSERWSANASRRASLCFAFGARQQFPLQKSRSVDGDSIPKRMHSHVSYTIICETGEIVVIPMKMSHHDLCPRTPRSRPRPLPPGP